MKTNYLFTFLSLILGSFLVQAQIVNIPDANFKNALVNTNCVDIDGNGTGDDDVDTNNDGEIQVSEAEAVTNWLRVTFQGITSLEGIASFINMKQFHCDGNNITELDLSQNVSLEVLICYDNPLTEFDATLIPNLRLLDISYCKLVTLNLGNPNLRDVWCEENNLTTINTTGAINLMAIQCHNNGLTSLDFSSNLNLDTVNCWGNQLTSLDFSNNSIIRQISCRNNNLINLNISNGNNINLERMWAHNNPNLECIKVDDEVFSNAQLCDQPNGTGWCKDETASYSEFCELAVTDFSENEIILFPNPTNHTLTLQSEFHIEKGAIYNLQGVLVKELKETNVIDVSELSQGLYFVEITSDGKKQIKKFIKS
ncbi:MAG: T9SS type A sorting domain-containing protein [Flavobacteriaceae bacterium]|nr:T9SS type A sorting domain-containing protein [Flavobacteriaceae bacterium]